MPSNPKPVRMWAWTDTKGYVAAVSTFNRLYSPHALGGTRIRVTVTPAKKPAKKGRKK